MKKAYQGLDANLYMMHFSKDGWVITRWNHTTAPQHNALHLLSRMLGSLLLLNLIARMVGVVAKIVMAAEARVVLGRTWHLASKLLESLALGFRDQQCGENTAQHEEGVDFHDVVEPWVRVGLCRVTAGAERTNEHLGDDGADLAGSGGDTVGGGTVASREA